MIIFKEKVLPEAVTDYTCHQFVTELLLYIHVYINP